MNRALLLLAAGCGNELAVHPVIETPDDGAVFADVDTIEMSVALDGEVEPLVSSIFRRGETLELPNVPYGENLVLHMVGRATNADVAYGRTCRFAVRAGEDPPSPHLYFARTVRWANAAVPPNPVRIGGSALTNRDGSALFIGGLDASGAIVLGADRFDPSTGTFEELASLTPRLDGAAANLGDGRAIVVGGLDPEGRASDVLDLISVEAGAEQGVEAIFAPQLSASVAPALATLSSGRVVSIGGRDSDGRAIGPLHEIAGEGAGTTIRQLPMRATLKYPRSGHTVTRLSNDLGAPVLIAGGRSSATPGMPEQALPVAELYRPLPESIAPPEEFARELATPRWDHTAVRLPDGSVLIIGGRNANGPVSSVEVFTLEAGFIAQGVLPVGAGLTELSVTSLPDGRVLIAGGRDRDGVPVDAAFIIRIDPLDGSLDIVTTDRLAAARAGHHATVLCDGTVLLVGGTAEPSASERYNPVVAGRN